MGEYKLLQELLAGYQLKKEIQKNNQSLHIVGSVIGDVYPYSVPCEILKALPELTAEPLKKMTAIDLRIDNYSSKIQKNIRILFSGNYHYSPSIKFLRRDVEVKAEIHDLDKEIFVSEIPPNESILITFFCPNNFELNQLLIDDHEVTESMQKLANNKRYPSVALMNRILLFILILAFASLAQSGYILYSLWRKTQENRLIDIAAAKSNLSACSWSVFDNSLDKEKLLERKFEQLENFKVFTLKLNKVSSLDELKKKEQVILCEPKKP
jgi:hypothetical protein